MDEIKKKNFILINSLGGGGAERQVSLISTLNEIDKIILLEPIVSYDIPKDKLIFLSNSPNTILQKVILLFTISSKLNKIGVDKNANLFCFLQLSYILGLITKFVLKCKFIICIRTSPFGFYEQYKGLKIPFFIYKYILKKADKIICNSKTSEIQLKEKLNLQQAITISNGYHIESLQKKANESIDELDQVFKNNKVLITVGRLIHDKSQWNLIRIFKELLKKENDLKLVILGEGELLNNLISLCQSLNLTVFNYKENIELDNKEADVYFLGFVKNPYKYVSKSKLLILTSLYEGLPNVVIESLIVKTPCILSDCYTGPREILLPNSDLLSQTNKEVVADCGILLPVFDGKEIFIESELNIIEKIWVKSISTILSQEHLITNMKLSCENINQNYNQDFILSQWRSCL